MAGIKLVPRRINQYTGEGFKSERFLAIAAVTLTIVSSVMLISLCVLQRKQVKLELEEAQRRKQERETKDKNNNKKA